MTRIFAAAPVARPCLQGLNASRRCIRVSGMGGMGPGMPGSDSAAGELNWDPEGLLRTRETNLIDRNLMKRRMSQDEKYREEVQASMLKRQKAVTKRRESRTPPEGDPFAMIDYLLDTPAEDLEFEIARCRPLLNDVFFQTLDREIGNCKFGVEAEKLEDRLVELEGMKQYLEMAIQALDKRVASLSSPVDRMKKLLTAKDKKEMIASMAEAGEIDQPLIDLLTQNITAAEAAGQKEAAEFMTKVRNAANRFLIATPDADALKAQFEKDREEADKFFEEAAEEAERLQRTGPDVSSMPRDASGAVLLQGKGGSKPSGGSGLIL